MIARSLLTASSLLIAFLSGCGPSVPEPPALPALKEPIPGPPPELYDGSAEEVYLIAQDMEGSEINEASTGVPFQVIAGFRWVNPPKDAPRSVSARLVQYHDGNPVIADENSQIPEVDEQGRCQIKLKLMSPPFAGKFQLRLQLTYGKVIEERDFEIIKSEENQD